MAAETTTAYQSLDTTRETSADQGVSVRAIRDTAASLNNYKHYAGAPVLVANCWPDDTVRSAASGTDETCILLYPAMSIVAYDRLDWSINAECAVAGANGEVTWKLYASQRLWTGGETVTAADLPTLGAHDVQSITASGTSLAWSHDLGSLVCFPNRDRKIYLMLTATAATSGNRCTIRGLTITATGARE